MYGLRNLVSHISSSNLLWRVMLSQNLALSPQVVLLVEVSSVAGCMLGLKNVYLLRPSSLAGQVQVASLSVESSSDSWVVLRAVRSMSVSFRDQIMDFLRLNVGIELWRFFLLKERGLLLGVEGGLALSNDWFKNTNSLGRKRAVSFGPLDSLVAGLGVESGSSVRVVQLVVGLVRLGPV